MPTGEGNAGEQWKTTICVISKKATLHVQHTFSYISLPLFCLQRGGGGSTPLYKLYRYVPPQRVGVMARFGLKTGIHFAHFGLESSVVFDGATGLVYNLFIV